MRASLILAGLLLVASSATAQQRMDLVVAATTDVHGRLRGWDYYADAPDSARGLARAATIVDSVRAANPGRVVLVDAGDLLQGNPLTYVADRLDTLGVHPVIAAMNVMRYDAAAVGNHEFNYGLPHLRRAIRQAEFPFLAANVEVPGRERRLGPRFAPSRIVTRAGVRVGIVGATNPGANVWDRDNLTGRLRITDIVPAVRRAVADVRRRGAQVVVVVMHSGLGEASSYDTVATHLPSENVAARVAREVRGIDLVVFGHSHREVADTTVNGVLLMQPRNWATSVGVATLSLERARAGWRVTARRGQVVRAAGHAEHPAVVAAVERTHRATVAWVNTTLGSTPVAWSADSARVKDTPLIDFINEVQRKASGADLSSSAAFDLNASLDAGPVTIAEVARLYPYDNTLRAIRITGRQLREYLEFSARYYRQLGSPAAGSALVDPSIPGFNFDIVSGADYVLDLSKPVGQRVTALSVRGRPVVAADSFTLALNNYRQAGGGGFAMLHGAPVVFETQEEIRDLLIAEVRARGTLRPQDYHVVNWRLAPDGVEGTAYRAMRALPFDRATGPSRPVAADAAAHLRSGQWVRVIGTNDFHGALEPQDPGAEGIMRGGAASLATAILAARAECVAPACVSLWVDGGDQWQGTAASNTTFGRSVVEIFNRLGLAAAALGNHDLDWGQDTLRARMREARYPILAANVVDSLGRDVSWIPDDTLIDLGSARVGVIGVTTTELTRVQRPSNLKGMTAVDPAGPVIARARALRARGADVVVVAAHLGASCDRETRSRCTGEAITLLPQLNGLVDAFVAGHTHQAAVTQVGGVALTEAWQRGTAIGIIDIPIRGTNGQVHRALRNVRPDSQPADPVIGALVEQAASVVRARFAVPVATLREVMRRGDAGRLGDLVADAQRWAAGADVAVMNRGGVRQDLRAGPMTYGDAFQVQPFDNMIVRVTVNGAALLAYLERLAGSTSTSFHLSGVRVEVDTSRPVGSRVVRAVLDDGRAVGAAGTYRVAMTDFLAEGGDGLGLDGRIESTGVLDRDALANYLKQLPQPVAPPDGPRFIRRPE
ncbi:MAG: 5'-nucleotidase C-terminal domain-containing protein [Gemmatimonadaceae bacterium]|nr:5'-nucleotidase C-terminal domain-containing protein [Gemmatimonadaceae bacterium]